MMSVAKGVEDRAGRAAGRGVTPAEVAAPRATAKATAER